MQTLYPSARSAFAGGLIDWDTDSFKVYSLDSTYAYDPAHDTVSDLTGVTGSVSLTGMTVLAGGVCDADDAAVPVAAADATERVIIAVDTGTPASDRLIYYADSYTSGVPIYRVSDGNPTVVSWSNGAGRIFVV